MIPKIIHYCWLSGEPMPERILACLESWTKVLPGYQVMRWDMDRFDIHSLPWTEQACECRKWAFAADYIRLYALYHYGGIYLDSDVRVFKSFDSFLEHRAFSGIEWWEPAYRKADKYPGEGENIEAAIMGAEAGHPVIADFMEYYHGRNFITPEGAMDMRPMPVVLTERAAKYGFRPDRLLHQVLEHDFHIYPYDYFTTQGGHQGDCSVTYNTVAMHLTTCSWGGPAFPRRRHSPFTEWRLHTIRYFKELCHDWKMHTVRYFKDLRDDVIVRHPQRS